jgi:hypothetical protein
METGFGSFVFPLATEMNIAGLLSYANDPYFQITSRTFTLHVFFCDAYYISVFPRSS